MKTDNNVLILIAAFIIMSLLTFVCYHQNNKINQYKQALEKTDTIIQQDTLYLEKVVKDTVPKYIHQHIIQTDTLWQIKDTAVEAQPIIITLIKKKSVTL